MNRLARLREGLLSRSDVDAVLVTNGHNRRYLSGFTGSSGALLISRDQALIITDFRYWEQVAAEVNDFVLVKQDADIWESIAETVKAHGWRSLAFEVTDLSVHHYHRLEGLIQGTRLIPLKDELNRLRWSKEPEEVELLREAARITDCAWEQTLKVIRPGVRERDIALEFDYQLRLNGAEGSSFTTIVISGVRSALPHGTASDKTVQPGELVLIDGGALYRGYHADMTRTVVLGRADAEQKRIYHLVLRAQLLALEGLHAGMTGREADAIARGFLAGEGYGGDYFGHGLGHSVGLEIHESPRLSVSEPEVIPVGAAVTVEPGVYIPGWGGVRIEDLVIVQSDGLLNLTHSPKMELMEL